MTELLQGIREWLQGPVTGADTVAVAFVAMWLVLIILGHDLESAERRMQRDLEYHRQLWHGGGQ